MVHRDAPYEISVAIPMNPPSPADASLVARIRAGEEAAWNELIARFEGRLLAFAESRLRRRDASEDVVQETFIGFLNSVANYDQSRPLETYLFSIAAHKLTDHLRRQGRRPALPLSAGATTTSQWDLPGPDRAPSSILRSGERRTLETTAVSRALGEEIGRWQQRGDWAKLKCLELLFVRGLANKEAAAELDLSEQQVANYKFDFLARLKSLIRKQDLPDEVFPELSEET
jgi:RNA polymerase sigma-70 factor (ECF subfamily)